MRKGCVLFGFDVRSPPLRRVSTVGVLAFAVKGVSVTGFVA
jgi:hypothetical protein